MAIAAIWASGWMIVVRGGDTQPAEVATDGATEISCTIRNTGVRAGADVVQLYLSDPVAQVVRPDHLPLNGSFTLTGPQRIVGSGHVLHTPVSVHDLPR